MVCYRIPVFLLLSVLYCCVSVFSEEEKNRQSIEETYAPGTDEPMLGDAEPVPTPSVCSEGTTCGFLVYDDPTTGEHEHKFTHYCHCPDDLECVREGENMELRYVYFKCRKLELFNADSSSDNSSPDFAEDRFERASDVPSQRENARNLKRFGYVNEEL